MSVLTRVVLTTAPTTLTPQVIGPTRIDLAWPAVLGAASYRVYRGGVLVDSPAGLTSSSTGLTPSTLYSFRVSSVGADGQEGPQGPQASANTTAAADTTAPTAPVLGTPTQSGSNSLIVSMTTASTDASGIASYALERATAAIGPFTLINSGALFPYTDLGLSASTTYWYRARATDNASNVGAYSNVVTQTTIAQTSAIRFFPGHYKWIDRGSGGGGQTGELAQIAALNGKSYMAGAKVSFDWDEVETSQNVYTFAKTDAYVAQAAAVNKKIMLEIRFEYFGNNPITANGRLPSYLSTIDGGNPGYSLWPGAPTPLPAGNLILVVHLWKAVVMARFNALWSALAGRYKDNATVVMVTLGETSIGSISGSGYGVTSWCTQMKSFMTTQRAAWPNTEIRVMTNYLSGDDGNKTQFKDLFAHMDLTNVAGGGPDNFSRTYDSNPIYTGFNGGVDYRNRISWVSESQYPASSSGGPGAGDTDATTSPVPSSANIYAHNESGALSAGGSTKPHYYVWLNNTYTGNPPSTGVYHTYPGETEPFIASIGGACNTTNPYTEFNYFISPTGSDANPGTQSSPWAITALNTKRTTYTGKTVGLLDGTYNVKSILDTKTDIDQWALDVDGGTSGAPTIIKSVNPRGAIINARNGSTYGNAASTPMLGHSGSTAHRGHVVFDGLVLTGHSRLGIRIGIFAVGSRIPGVIVRNCEFTGFNGSAFGINSGLNFEQLEMNRCTGYIVQNNYFHDNVGEVAGSNDHFSALLTWECDQGLIEYNTCVNSGGFYAKEWEQWGHTIQYNYVDVSALSSDASQALQDFCGSAVDNGVGTTIHHNVLIAAQVATLIQTLGEGGFITPSLSFYNNTCVIKPSAASRGPVFRSVAGQLNFYNNIIVDEATGDHTYCAINVNGPGVFDYNLWFTAGDDQWSTYSNATDTSRDTVSTYAAFKSAIPGADVHGISGSNPLFVASGTGAARYDLQSGSPARNAGKLGGLITGATVHMGALDGVVTRVGCDF